MIDTHIALADLAQQIRSFRAEDGLTRQQLATRSGVAQNTINKARSAPDGADRLSVVEDRAGSR
jgi:transcriptional regulator with XRE-family HTH domain